MAGKKLATGMVELLERRTRKSQDVAVAEAAAAVTGLAARDVARLAEDYAAADPAVIRIGWGLERNRNGGSAVAAVLALPALAGKFGRRGGGFTMSNSGAFRVDDEARAGGPEPSTRIVNISSVSGMRPSPNARGT